MSHSGSSRVGSRLGERRPPDSELDLPQRCRRDVLHHNQERSGCNSEGLEPSDFGEEIAARPAVAASRSGCSTYSVMGKYAKDGLGIGFGQAFQGINGVLDVPASALPRVLESP